LLRGIAIELAILLGLIYLPPLADLFEHVAIPRIIWAGLIFFPVIIYSLDWIRKWIVRWRERFVQQVINSSVSKEEI
jgi:hypothetical protein